MASVVVISKVEACPYCGTERSRKLQCCDEVHFEDMFAVEIEGVDLDYLVSQEELDTLQKASNETK